MAIRQHRIFKWALYGLLALLALLLQTSVVGNLTLLGAHFSILPAAVCCTAMREGRDSGAVYGLCCGVLQALSGTSYGAVYILTLTLVGMLSGMACDFWLRRGFLTALLLSFLSVLLVEGAVCLLLIFTEAIPAYALSRELLPTCLISLIFTPLFHLCAGGISRSGGRYGT